MIARLGLVALSSISDICFESQMVPDSNVIRGDDDSVVSFFFFTRQIRHEKTKTKSHTSIENNSVTRQMTEERETLLVGSRQLIASAHVKYFLYRVVLFGEA